MDTTTLRHFFSVTGTVAPGLAAWVAERLWFTPPRPPVSAATRAALSKGDAFPLAVDGRRLAAWSFGEGPTVALMHGWGGYAGQLEPFIAPLVAAGHRVVAFDAPGHGSSPASSAGRRQSTFLDFAAALQAIAASTGPVHGIVAHSGGAVATGIALRQGLTVKRLALLAPMTRPAEYAALYSDALGLSLAVQERWQTRATSRLKGSWASFDVTTLSETNATPATLVVHDKADREVPFADGELLATRWPGAELHPVSGLGHRRLLKDADVIRRTVEFLE
jgi:alpha-beta hydrolase superfamily lysophospholipase